MSESIEFGNIRELPGVDLDFFEQFLLSAR